MTFPDRRNARSARAAVAARRETFDRRLTAALPALMGASALALSLVLATAVSAAPGDSATAMLKNADGDDVGEVELTETPHGMLLHANLENLPQGTHAFHVHETGACEPPFESAGGHFNPQNVSHGFKAERGVHAGDLPNIHVPDEGSLEIEVFTPLLTFAALQDNDGAAVVIHEGADDYETDPAGDAGDRIACGVIER